MIKMQRRTRTVKQKEGRKPPKRHDHAKTFEKWWSTVPADLRKKVKGNDNWNKYKPLLNQINYVLMVFNTSGKHDMMPSLADLQSWIKNGEIDVVRIMK